ncbi:MAG TPA: lipase maturation factor family protein [Candidatus Binatia bacterium]|nr:lipase maturation factor family protein [Candidatus Binatia bacterium]
MTGQPTYWLTRFAILRLLGAVYLVAFLALARQVLPLLGSDGLLPVVQFLPRVQAHFGSPAAAARALPTLFWLGAPDGALVAGAWFGVGLAGLVVVGFGNAILFATLWVLYLSYVHVGQDWYGYGWEIQLLETGFLAIFLCPLLDPRPFPSRPPPTAVVWLLRWLVFRIMLGAGLIKVRGDPCWRDLTCLYWHYETQPIPNPVSPLLHFMPPWFHRAGAAFNHVAELAAPWFVFGPRRARTIAGMLLLAFQLFLIVSGNLSFLNWLTIVPILACFDDAALARVLPRRLVAAAAAAHARARPSPLARAATAALVVLVAVLSIRPVANLVSPGQVMNTAFDPLDLVNTYGAFGTVGRERDEIVFEGTRGETLGDDARWLEYEFPCKPGDPHRRPCLAAPYQYRMAWQLWFAAMSTPARYPWTLHLVWKLLQGDDTVRALLERDPFPDAPPRYVRALLYRYTFARPGNADGVWWERTLVGTWLPPLATDDPRLRSFLAAHGWLPDGNRAP